MVLETCVRGGLLCLEHSPQCLGIAMASTSLIKAFLCMQPPKVQAKPAAMPEEAAPVNTRAAAMRRAGVTATGLTGDRRACCRNLRHCHGGVVESRTLCPARQGWTLFLVC